MVNATLHCGRIMAVGALSLDHPAARPRLRRGGKLRIGALALCVLVGGTLWGMGVAPAEAEWPDRPVRLVVPFAAGGAADVIARLFADNLSVVFSQQFVV